MEADYCLHLLRAAEAQHRGAKTLVKTHALGCDEMFKPAGGASHTRPGVRRVGTLLSMYSSHCRPRLVTMRGVPSSTGRMSILNF